MRFGHAGVGDCYVDIWADLGEGGEEGGPAGCVGVDVFYLTCDGCAGAVGDGGGGGGGGVDGAVCDSTRGRWIQVEDVDGGAAIGEDLDGGETDSRGAAYLVF